MSIRQLKEGGASCLSLSCVLTILIFAAQDGPSHQHLLQCGEAAMAARQRGRGARGGAERARHVRDGGLLDHLGEACLEAAPLLCSLRSVCDLIMPLPQCLTGGKNGGVHSTDVSNASRTMLFNIHTMDWDPELCR